MLTLTAEGRGVTKSARNGARRKGFIPAVVYGKNVTPTPIMVDRNALRETIKEGMHRLIRLTGPGLERPVTVLIKDLQTDDVRNEVVHVDFFEPAVGRRFHVRVPLVVIGDDALTKRGLIMERHLGEVDCECFPDNVPEAIYVDASQLEPGEHISLGDLHAPDGVRLTGNPDAVVLTVEVPMETMIPGEGPVEVTAGE